MSAPPGGARGGPRPPLALSVAGHYWTIAPLAAHTLRPRPAPPSRSFWATVEDPKVGAVRLSGRLRDRPGDALVVLIHGLGGDVGSHYLLEAARAAEDAGLSSLRLNLRGADRTGEDFYHAALTADLHAAIASPELARYERLYLLGYSLGGHLALRCATEPLDPRVRAVAAICPPLDLAVGAHAIDEPRRAVYRRHVLTALQEIYAAVARRREVPLPVPLARRIRKLREWDQRVVAPRFGFDSVAHYYHEASVAPRLTHLTVPALVVEARHDPMVPEATVLPALERISPMLDARWIERGGHVGFPASATLGVPGPPGIEGQALAWLRQRH